MEIRIVKISSDEEKNLFDEMPIYGYYASPTASNENTIERNRMISDDLQNREYLLYEDENAVSGGGYAVLDQNIRGSIYRMGGILNINTYPEARKKGYVNQLMKRMFKDMREENLAVTCLYPFKESFYGRYGYINFPQYRTLTIKPGNLRDIDHYDIGGTFRRGKLKDHWDEFVTLQQKLVKRIHGFSIFQNLENMSNSTIKNAWAVIVELDDEVTGAMSYTTKGIFKEAKVTDFLYLNTITKMKLLQYIYAHTDQFKEFEIPLRPGQNPEYWGFDINAKVETRQWVPSPQGRVLIVDELNGMNSGTGNVAIRIHDNYCDWNNKNFNFSSKDGKLVIEETDEIEFELDIAVLSALIFGTYTKTDFKYRWGLDISSEMIDTLTRMFPPELPWLYSGF